MLGRQVLAVMLAASLAFPLSASPADPAIIGIASSARQATLNGTGVQSGSTVFSGEWLATRAQGGAVLSVAGSMLRFGGASSARLVKSAQGAVQVELHSGQMAYRSSATAPVEIHLGDAVVRASGGQPAVAVAAYVSPDKIVIAVERGQLRIGAPGNSPDVTVRAGESAELTLTDAVATQQAPVPAGKSQSKKRRLIAIAILVGGGITLLALLLNNGDAPDGLVSPFQVN